MPSTGGRGAAQWVTVIGDPVMLTQVCWGTAVLLNWPEPSVSPAPVQRAELTHVRHPGCVRAGRAGGQVSALPAAH